MSFSLGAGRRPAPLVAGFVWALLAAVAFGVSTPLVRRFGAPLGPWSIAALLYAGAALFAWPLARDVRRVVRSRGSRAILIAEGVVGAMLAPAALAYGLKFTGALGASLALNAEVPFSIAIAALVFREFVTRRVVVACAAILAGASLLVWNGAAVSGGAAGIGVVFVLVATLLWALDNALSSLLVDVPFATTVACKATLGALFASAAATLAREPAIPAANTAALAGVGALGYGASLWAYLRAQRTFGIARTASVFALAPFVGAGVAFALGERGLSPLAAVAFALVAFGAYVHASERHSHVHAHEPVEHEHEHAHDDGHHEHEHGDGTGARGSHVHRHRHDPLVHDHAHAPDPAHAHVHGAP